MCRYFVIYGAIDLNFGTFLETSLGLVKVIAKVILT